MCHILALLYLTKRLVALHIEFSFSKNGAVGEARWPPLPSASPPNTTTKIIYADSICVNIGFRGELHHTGIRPNENGTVGEGQSRF